MGRLRCPVNIKGLLLTVTCSATYFKMKTCDVLKLQVFVQNKSTICLKRARAQRVQFKVETFLHHLESERNFFTTIARVKQLYFMTNGL